MQVGDPGLRRRAGRIAAGVAAVALLAPAAIVSGVGVERVAALGDVSADFSTQPLGADIGGPPATGQAGVPWATQPVVSLSGDWNPTLEYGVDLRIDPSSPDVGGPGRLVCTGGTTVAMVGGVATFRGCRIDLPGRAYRLAAYVTPFDPILGPLQGYPAASLPFDIADEGPAPAATALGFTTQPLGATYGGPRPSTPAGRAWSIQPVVSVLDAQGDVVIADSSTIVVLDIAPGAPQAGGPGTLSCAAGLSARVFRGVARFSGCSIDMPGAYYQLRAQTVTSGSTLVLTDISLPFDIGGGNVPARARFTVEPLGATLGGQVPTAASGTPWAVQPVVSIVDAAGRVVRTDVETTVTLSIDGSSLPAGGQLHCAGGTTLQVYAGLAAFTGCQIVGAGEGYVLRATAQTPGGAVLHDLSLPFSIGPASTSLELLPSAFTVAPGGRLTLAATLEGPGHEDRAITFQRQGPADDGWTDVGTSQANASGTASISTAVAYTSRFRAVFGGGGSLAAVTSAPDTVAVQARVTLAPARTSVKKGTTITYTARVAPVPLGAAVVRFQVWRYASGSWTYATQRSVGISPAGVATLAWRWSAAGRWRIVAIAPTSDYAVQGSSRPVTVTVR